MTPEEEKAVEAKESKDSFQLDATSDVKSRGFRGECDTALTRLV